MNSEGFSFTPATYRRFDQNAIRIAAQQTILHKYEAEVNAEVLRTTRHARMLETAVLCLESGLLQTQAIKILRTAFFDAEGDSIGLKEAKDIVDRAAFLINR